MAWLSGPFALLSVISSCAAWPSLEQPPPERDLSSQPAPAPIPVRPLLPARPDSKRRCGRSGAGIAGARKGREAERPIPVVYGQARAGARGAPPAPRQGARWGPGRYQAGARFGRSATGGSGEGAEGQGRCPWIALPSGPCGAS